MTEPRSESLFYRDGRSDKVYHLDMSRDPGGWTVAARYGRRNKPLMTDIKGTGLPAEKATGVFDGLLAKKIAKGYSPMESGQAFGGTVFEARSTGFRPQLFNEITDAEARSLGGDWLVQEKHDGERRGAAWNGERAVFSNRRGLEVSVDPAVSGAFERLGRMSGVPFALDCEDMGDHLVVFDVLEYFMLDERTFRERASILENVRKSISYHGLSEFLRVDVPTPADVFFDRFADRLREGGAEGYVIRHADSVNTPGRPASGGDALKVKYWAEATCRVAQGREGRASIGLELRDGKDGPWVPVGNVTVPKGAPMPRIGELVEVRYLYAFPGGSLFQPVLKGPRTDLTEEAARMAQLKIRRADPAEEPGEPGP